MDIPLLRFSEDNDEQFYEEDKTKELFLKQL